MNILLLGSGGRESAIALSIQKSIFSGSVAKLFAIPGNPQIETIGTCHNVLLDNRVIKDFCVENNIQLVIVGPEELLANGLVDYLGSFDIAAFGPSQKAAQIESSKIFMKDFCTKYNIPTAKYRTFYKDKDSKDDIIRFAQEIWLPIVLKTNGLANGKWVVICESFWDFEDELSEYFNGKFGDAGRSIVIEEFLYGKEVSFFSLSDGKHFKTIGYACDHKKLLDNNKWPNTGGMWTYSSKTILSEAQIDEINKHMIQPLVEWMNHEGHPYKWVIFAGIIITPQWIKLIEYNARFGDPETQSILPLLKNDIVELFLASVNGNLEGLQVEISDKACVNIVCVSHGYPNDYQINFPISWIEHLSENVSVFHSGTKNNKNILVTNGWRVLSLCSIDDTIASAADNVYHEIEKIRFEGMQYRHDIWKNCCI